jgi:glycerol-3-phosphate dehydrogenase (NAD(P)+)
MTPSHNIVILGGGAFGTAIATVLAANNHSILIWCHEPETTNSINSLHENTHYLPGKKLSKNIQATSDLKTALAFGTLIFESIPVHYMRNIFIQAQPYITPEHKIVILSKGMENNTLLLPTQIIEEVLNTNIITAVLAGPNFAQELAEQKSSAATLASNNLKFAQYISMLTINDFFKLSLSDDRLGVQLCATLKNVITILIGIARGAGCGENTIAFLVTLGLKEIKKIITHFNGNPQTAYQLCGIGDLMLTALGTQSRNLKAGNLLGAGKTIQEVEQQLGILPEGINSTISIYQLCQKANLNLPLCKGTYDIIFNRLSMQSFITNLSPNNE